MKRGSGLRRCMNSFVSSLVLVIMLYVFSAGTVHMTLLKNLTELNMNLNRLDRQVFIECLVMQRIKYAAESLDYDETPLMYDGCTVRLSYFFEDVHVVYEFPDYSLERDYHYDLEKKILLSGE